MSSAGAGKRGRCVDRVVEQQVQLRHFEHGEGIGRVGLHQLLGGRQCIVVAAGGAVDGEQRAARAVAVGIASDGLADVRDRLFGVTRRVGRVCELHERRDVVRAQLDGLPERVRRVP